MRKQQSRSTITGATERTNDQRLDDMLQFATEVTEFAGQAPRNARETAMTRYATIYLLEIIGVAAAGMTEAFRAKFPSIPWADAIAMMEFIGKPDELLDLDAVHRGIHEVVPVLLRELTNLKSGEAR